MIIEPRAVDIACDLIRVYEGYKSIAYQDSGGKWTIGFGHTSRVYAGLVCSRTQADAWLADDVKAAVSIVGSTIRRDLTDHQTAALIDLAFNIGAGNFSRSTLVSQINIGKLDDVPHQISRWNKDAHGTVLPGLVKRRAAEVLLWNTPDPPRPVAA